MPSQKSSEVRVCVEHTAEQTKEGKAGYFPVSWGFQMDFIQTFNNPFYELYTELNLKRSDGKGYLLYKSTEWHEMEELLENTSA